MGQVHTNLHVGKFCVSRTKVIHIQNGHYVKLTKKSHSKMCTSFTQTMLTFLGNEIGAFEVSRMCDVSIVGTETTIASLTLPIRGVLFANCAFYCKYLG